MVPLGPDGHVFFGDIALRCYKHKARWTYEEQDIRPAGHAFPELHLDLDDVVELQLPAYRDGGDRNPEGRHRTDWRRQLVSWMFGQARRKTEEWGAWKETEQSGCPAG